MKHLVLETVSIPDGNLESNRVRATGIPSPMAAGTPISSVSSDDKPVLAAAHPDLLVPRVQTDVSEPACEENISGGHARVSGAGFPTNLAGQMAIPSTKIAAD